jgi:hypothetical protein
MPVPYHLKISATGFVVFIVQTYRDMVKLKRVHILHHGYDHSGKQENISGSFIYFRLCGIGHLRLSFFNEVFYTGSVFARKPVGDPALYEYPGDSRTREII